MESDPGLLRVMLVEDSMILRGRIRDLIEQSCRARVVSEAGTIAAALAFLPAEPPDVVVLDLHLPDGSGLDVLRAVKKSRPTCPVIVLTSFAMPETRDHCRSLGADYFFDKSREFERVVEVLRECVSLDAERPAADFTSMKVALEASEERLSRVLKSAGVGTWSWDVIANSVAWDDHIHPLFGLPAKTYPSCIEDFLDLVHPGDRERVEREVTASVEKGAAYDTEFRVVWPDGTSRHLATRGHVDRDAERRPLRMTGVCWDITEHKNLEAQLRRTQRLEGIGTLASGVAHDLNNILAPILMSIPVLEEALAGTDCAPVLSTIQECAERGAEIVKQVLTFARGVEGERVLVQTHHHLRDMEKIAGETFPRSITVRNCAPHGLWPVSGDATQIHQVLLNLCVNARDAMPRGGLLTIDAGNLLIDESYAAMRPDAKPGPYLMISISDTGHGIPAEIAEKIFDPFFTTKEIGKGTGLGLSTVAGIVRSHGGFLSLESKPGAGSTFTVFLPAEPDTAAAPDHKPVATAPSGNGEMILVVDDESSVRSISQTVLKAHGYRVLLASDGTEALAVFAQHSAEIAVVVTDLAMPFMDGGALIPALRKMKPGLRVIISTGHGEKARTAGLEVSAFLHKPYDAHTLLCALHSAVSERRAATI
ncbi:MAG: response regulator [Chthoniobacteraceae bacterium]